jgi:hypothetical protein
VGVVEGGGAAHSNQQCLLVVVSRIGAEIEEGGKGLLAILTLLI